MEIEVGEFVRLARNQGINKIIEIEDGNRYILDEDIADEYGDFTCVLKKNELDEEVLKHSKNIIDLIEVDDYVNGKRVTDYYFVGTQKVLVLDNEKVAYEENENFVPNLAIKSILTKEQFEGNCYRLEE